MAQATRRSGMLLLAAGLTGALACAPRGAPHGRRPAGECTYVAESAEVRCGPARFAVLSCEPRIPFGGCRSLALTYADGGVARVYRARGDPKFDVAGVVLVARDGSRVWYRETKGLRLRTRWHEVDVFTGASRELADRDGVALLERANGGDVVRFAVPGGQGS